MIAHRFAEAAARCDGAALAALFAEDTYHPPTLTMDLSGKDLTLWYLARVTRGRWVPWTFLVSRSSRCSAGPDWQTSLPRLRRHSPTRWMPKSWIASALGTDCRGSP